MSASRDDLDRALSVAYDEIDKLKTEIERLKGWQGEPVAWSTEKPESPGAHWIRGFNLSGEFNEAALVQVVLDDDAQVLMVNLHQSTTETDTGYWYEVDDINEEFEWCGPLFASQPAPVSVDALLALAGAL